MQLYYTPFDGADAWSSLDSLGDTPAIESSDDDVDWDDHADEDTSFASSNLSLNACTATQVFVRFMNVECIIFENQIRVNDYFSFTPTKKHACFKSTTRSY